MVEKKEKDNSNDSIPVPDPTDLTRELAEREIKHLRELIEARIGEVVSTIDEKFVTMNVKAEERDRRYDAEFTKLSSTAKMMVDQQALALTATKEAVSIAMQAAEKAVTKAEDEAERRDLEGKRAIDTALSSAKEAVRLQQDANAAAIAKQEAVFVKQIDQIGAIINSQAKTVDDKIDDLKTRLLDVDQTARKNGGPSSIISIMLSVVAVVIVLGSLGGYALFSSGNKSDQGLNQRLDQIEQSLQGNRDIMLENQDTRQKPPG